MDIYIVNEGGLHFEIYFGSELVTLSRSFDSICQLERSLSLLLRLALSNSFEIDQSSGGTAIRQKGQRAKIVFYRSISSLQISKILQAVSSASVIDRRPINRRRFDLSGPLQRVVHE